MKKEKWPILKLPIQLKEMFTRDRPLDPAFLYDFGHFDPTEFLLAVEAKTGTKYDYHDVLHCTVIDEDGVINQCDPGQPGSAMITLLEL